MKTDMNSMKSMMSWLMSSSLMCLFSSFTYGEFQPNNAYDPTNFNGRVAILISNRSNIDENFCMGLLVAQDFVLAHAHCIKSNPNLTWAYFGDSSVDENGNQKRSSGSTDGYDDDDDYDYDYGYHDDDDDDDDDDELSPEGAFVGQTPNTSRHDSTVDCNQSPERCDTEDWIRIKTITIHPEYQLDVENTLSKVFGLVQLTSPSIHEPFKLLAEVQNSTSKLNTTEGGTVRAMRAFSVKNSFMTGSRDAKIEDLGDFRKYDENYCRSGAYSRHFHHTEDGLLCLVAASVDKRYLLDAANSFVMLEDKLAGISTCDGHCQLSPLNQFSLLSEGQEFIDQTCRPEWSSQLMDIKNGDDTSLKGFLSGLRNSKSGMNFCSGSLIHPKFVFTAAHCVYETEVTHVSVGSLYALSEYDGEQIRVRKTLIHPNFDPKTLANDYALIELEYISIQPPIILDDTSEEEVFAGQRLTLYGYGASSGPTSTLIKEVQLPVVGNDDCERILQGPRIGEKLLCAGGEEGKDGCNGDSGGPLVRTEGQDLLLVGISSYGRGCGLKGIPAVYARLTHAKDFINKYVPKPKWRSAMRDSGSSNSNSNKPSGSKAPPPSGNNNKNNNNHNRPNPSGNTGKDSTDNTSARNAWVEGKIDLSRLPGKTVTAQSEYTKKAILGTFLKGVSMDEYRHDYTCREDIDLYSSYDLSRVLEIIAKYDARFLSRKSTRFGRAVGNDRLPHC